jgi:hypothetical protein
MSYSDSVECHGEELTDVLQQWVRSERSWTVAGRLVKPDRSSGGIRAVSCQHPVRLWRHSTWEIVFSFPIRRGTCIGWNPAGAIWWPVSSHLTQQDGFKRHPQHNSVLVATILLFHFSRHLSYAVQRFRGTCRLTDSELDAFLNKSLTPSWDLVEISCLQN